MPSPAYIFRFLNDAQWAEVQAYALQVMMGGQISSLSGGQKSVSFSAMSAEQFLIEYKAEFARRGGQVPADKVYSDFRTTHANGL